jgi:hypothetical protein
MLKVTGTPIASFHGLDIYAKLIPSKTGKGKERALTFALRSNGFVKYTIPKNLFKSTPQTP